MVWGQDLLFPCSYTRTFHPEKTKLCSCSQSNCSSHAVLCRFSLSSGTWIGTKAPKSTRAGTEKGQYWAMRGRDLLSWCYTNTKATCSRRKPSTETSIASVQSRLSCQQHSACWRSDLFRRWTQLVFTLPKMFTDLLPIDFPHRAISACTPTLFWTQTAQFTQQTTLIHSMPLPHTTLKDFFQKGKAKPQIQMLQKPPKYLPII